ncbi:hypothetical protein PIB30_018001 [Stylosanthes scabra]|uniref:Uncharacterized protein n=1 Tax=Stylosanthes scabra TaxID=79078 RepID=A0ABU6V7N8_9FABA|nr:hypothetical protein [Stylosanthes scabra]
MVHWSNRSNRDSEGSDGENRGGCAARDVGVGQVVTCEKGRRGEDDALYHCTGLVQPPGSPVPQRFANFRFHSPNRAEKRAGSRSDRPVELVGQRTSDLSGSGYITVVPVVDVVRPSRPSRLTSHETRNRFSPTPTPRESQPLSPTPTPVNHAQPPRFSPSLPSLSFRRHRPYRKEKEKRKQKVQFDPIYHD